MTNPLVAFDESGNTGQDLLNPTQPVFSLVSVYLTDSQTDDAIRIISPQIVQEAKFTRLRRSKYGQQRIISLLRSEHVNPNTVKVNVVHKSYMVTSKIVDLLIEPLAHRDGINLYERGGNIALANLYHTCLPVVSGEERFTSFQQSFVEMIRNKDETSVEKFYETCQDLYDSCKLPDFKPDIAVMIASKSIVSKVLEAADITALDPAPTSFVLHCAAWGSYFGQEFDLVHDESKPMRRQQQLLSYLMAKDEPEVEVGYDYRKMTLPLKASGIRFANSKTIRQLQVADIIAGASAYWAVGLAGANVDRDFHKDLDTGGLRNLIINAIWPSSDVTPKELGTEEIGGTNAVDYVAKLISRREKKDRLLPN
jgi:hypothetical protein